MNQTKLWIFYLISDYFKTYDKLFLDNIICKIWTQHPSFKNYTAAYGYILPWLSFQFFLFGQFREHNSYFTCGIFNKFKIVNTFLSVDLFIKANEIVIKIFDSMCLVNILLTHVNGQVVNCNRLIKNNSISELHIFGTCIIHFHIWYY